MKLRIGERPCHFCGTPTTARAWQRGTKRFWKPICSGAACWRKFYAQK